MKALNLIRYSGFLTGAEPVDIPSLVFIRLEMSTLEPVFLNLPMLEIMELDVWVPPERIELHVPRLSRVRLTWNRVPDCFEELFCIVSAFSSKTEMTIVCHPLTPEQMARVQSIHPRAVWDKHCKTK